MPTIRSKPRPKAAADLQLRSVTVLGATGSVGSSTVDLLKREPGRYRIEAVTAHRNAAELAEVAMALGARFAVVSEPSAYEALKTALAGSGIEAGAGPDALVEAAERPADWVMAAVSGAAGLRATLAAARRGVTVALANKECLVCAGDLFMRTAADHGATVLPVDSEHNAIFQALTAGPREGVSRIVITASGGPFRTWTRGAMRAATVEQALKHPNWSMGPKITIDSATMFNKVLELVEAHHLFAVDPDQLAVLVHPQSIIHGMVEYRDGSVVAQLGSPDMRTPIAHCLAWPGRIDGPSAKLDLAKIGQLTFEAPDEERFPSLRLGRRVLKSGGGAPTILNAANEVAVAAFLDKRIGFGGIAALVEATLDAAERRNAAAEPNDIDEALAIDQLSRSMAHELMPEIAAKWS